MPQRDIISATVVELEQGRLKVAPALPEAETFRRELLNFKRTVDPRTAHDDIVFAVSLAVWWRGWYHEHLDRQQARRLVSGVR